MTKPKSNLDQTYQKLQSIVEEFEQGRVQLDHAPDKFEEAVKLAQTLKTNHQTIKNRVEEIQSEFQSSNQE